MLLETILSNFTEQKDKTAFCIEDVFYTYQTFSEKVASIQQLLIDCNIKENDIVIVKTFNDLETYASILAVWFTGATFVPINPSHPKDRNDLISKQIKSKITLSSCANANEINTKNTSKINKNPELLNTSPAHILYILFTSGSTGVPKGVPISIKNLDAFITDFNEYFNLKNTDRFLQIYDLTFDASVHCYTLPLFVGGCIFTVSPNKIKYLEAYKIMSKHQITFAKFPPTVLSYLKPFFNKIDLPNLTYSLLGGESLNVNLVKQWQESVPNTTVFNVYGPTEATINTHIYNISENRDHLLSENDITSIGKPFGKNKALIIDDKQNEVAKNVTGELCLYGEQITPGYFNNPIKNEFSFFYFNGEMVYKTGDLAYIDDDGNFIFCDRKDNQVQIQGFRVELAEIESVARQFKNALNYSVVTEKNKYDVLEIVLFTEQFKGETGLLNQFLKEKLPVYMLPSKIINLDCFPLTSSGKIDRQTLISNYLK